MNRAWIIPLLVALVGSAAACGKREKPIDPVSGPIDPASARFVEEAARAVLIKPTGELTDEDRQRVINLNLSGTAITDLRPLLRYPHLMYLGLYHCTELRDLGPLANVPTLQVLYMGRSDGISDLRPLINLPKFRVLNTEGCPRIREIPRALTERKGFVWVCDRFLTPAPTPKSDLPA